MNRTDRLLSIALKLEPSQWRRAEDLAAMLGVSTRTIYRDMQVLGEVGLPVSAVPGKGYRIEEGRDRPPVTFTGEEAAVLLQGLRSAAQQGSERERAAARSARAKIEAVLPDAFRERLARERTEAAEQPVNAFDDPRERALLAPLRQALGDQQAVRFRYTGQRSGGANDTACSVYPYSLVTYGGVRHLVGSRREDGRVQAFRLDRMQDLTVLDERFERPPGYQAASSEPDRDLVVRVHFGVEAARWVQEVLPPFAERVEPQADGVILVLKVQRAAETLPWLLSWGAYAHVLTPHSLRHRLAEEAKQIAAHYQEAPTLL